MRLRDELKFSIMKSYIHFLLVSLTVSSFAVMLYILVYFGFSIKNEQFNIEEKNNGRIVYNIFDDISDPEEFIKFSHSYEKLNKVISFYDYLNSMTDYEYHSIFSQPLFLETFKGDRSFDGTPESPLKNGKYYEVKSIQLNKKAFEFNNIKSDDNFDWEKIDYEDNIIPVLLGNSYKGAYKRGDIFKGNYYLAKSVNFKVIGFTNKNSALFYNNQNYILDTSIIIPYPEKARFVNKDSNLKFYSALYFNMIRGDIITPENQTPNDILTRLRLLEKKTGFNNIALGGHNALEIQYLPLMNFIDKISMNIFIYISFLSTLMIFVNIILFKQIYKARKKNNEVLTILGYDQTTRSIVSSINLIVPIIFATILFIISIQFFPFNLMAFITSYIGLVIFCTLPYTLYHYTKGKN